MATSPLNHHLPSYEESQSSPSPPPAYTTRPPSLSDIPEAYRYTSQNQTVTPSQLTQIERTTRGPKRSRSPCLLLFAYILAICSCLFCCFVFGLLALGAVYLSERNFRDSHFNSNGKRCNKSFTYLVLSIVLSVAGILFTTIVISVIVGGSIKHSMDKCRFETSKNDSCCEPLNEDCDMRLIKRGENGCKYCCHSEDCLNRLKELPGCQKCQKYSEEIDWFGCPFCCIDPFCLSSELYTNAFGCKECCPRFSEESCTRNGITYDKDTGCKMCCQQCAIKSTSLDKDHCWKCCNESKSCDKNGSYLDGNGCSQCCLPHLKNCSYYSVNYKIEICRQCCKNPPLYTCSYDGKLRETNGV